MRSEEMRGSQKTRGRYLHLFTVNLCVSSSDFIHPYILSTDGGSMAPGFGGLKATSSLNSPRTALYIDTCQTRVHPRRNFPPATEGCRQMSGGESVFPSPIKGVLETCFN